MLVYLAKLQEENKLRCAYSIARCRLTCSRPRMRGAALEVPLFADVDLLSLCMCCVCNRVIGFGLVDRVLRGVVWRCVCCAMHWYRALASKLLMAGACFTLTDLTLPSQKGCTTRYSLGIPRWLPYMNPLLRYPSLSHSQSPSFRRHSSVVMQSG
jgi:hypothetical protein